MRRRKQRSGIALFILLTSVVIMSLMMRELIQSSSNQSSRVRNSADRIQAVYLARSSLNLARFILYLDQQMDSLLATQGREAADTLFIDQDFWNAPNYFPLKTEEIVALTQAVLSPDQQQEAQEGPDQDLLKRCEDFFEGFPGSATSLTSDLSGRFVLNDLQQPSEIPLNVFTQILSPNYDFVRHLESLRTTPEALAREFRDYCDTNSEEEETKTPEESAYSAMNLDYGPKNRVFILPDEIKRIPHVDDVIFDYLEELVNPYFGLPRPAIKININTAPAAIFQALIRDRADGEELAKTFIDNRTTQRTIYTASKWRDQLRDAVPSLGDKEFYDLITTVSDSFKIETTATVNQITLQLETILSRQSNSKKLEQIRFIRISP